MVELTVSDWLFVNENEDEKMTATQKKYMFLQIMARVMAMYLSPVGRILPVQMRIEEQYRDGSVTGERMGRLVLLATNSTWETSLVQLEH